MKMADAGLLSACNFHSAVDTAKRVIVGVDLSNAGSHHGQLMPMVAQVETRHGQPPAASLVDGGFVTKEDIEAVNPRTTVYAPVPKPKDPAPDPHVPLAGDSEAVPWRDFFIAPEASRLAPPLAGATPRGPTPTLVLHLGQRTPVRWGARSAVLRSAASELHRCPTLQSAIPPGALSPGA